jgi:exodeoxyribonuclease III
MPKRVLVAIAAISVVAAGGLFSASCSSEDETTLTAMSYNIWGGGGNESKPVDETVAVIEKAGADVIGIQETRLETGHRCTANYCPPGGKSVAEELADALGFHYYDQTKKNDALWANAILSRYPIGDPTANDLGVEIDVDGRSVYAFNVHLDDSPYQPYQLLDIEYGGAPFIDTESQAIRFARQTRGSAIELLSEDLAQADGADATFVFGDFNEPSAHDWTKPAVAADQQPLEVAWPTTRSIEELGFVDTYREVYPDPAEKPAFTWTPTSKPTVNWDHHDRIDFVLARGDDLRVEDAAIVGEGRPEADIVVKPWPSDHRATAATVEF